jgi:hypothetical protein
MIYIAVAPNSVPELREQRRKAIERFLAAIQAGDFAVLQEVLATDAVTRWPQTGERINGSLACVKVYQQYPGGPPNYRIERISGDGDVWVAEITAAYGSERWHVVSVIEFEGLRIARLTDYFAPSSPAPDWRKELVERDAVPAPALVGAERPA